MNTRGYTLLEVTLFLTISAALTAAAIAGLGPRLNNVRFTQSVRGVESSITEQFSASNFGENNRPAGFTCVKASWWGVEYPSISNSASTATGGAKDCVINGRLIVFEPTRMLVYTVVSLRDSVGTPAACSSISFEIIRDCYKPRTARGTIPFQTTLTEPPEKTVINYQNGLTATSSINNDGKLLAFGTVQNPNGTGRYQFFHLDGANAGYNKPDLNSANTATSVANPSVCFKMSNRTAKLSFSTTSTIPVIKFEECS
ncbi:hypothetical protein KBD20_02205 [Candidatus Saccharibacteria bacterium]|nr:hypothetical protein [Candidatus Saccharibacteria bacterium]